MRYLWLCSFCDSSFAIPSASVKHHRPSLEGLPLPGVLAKGKAGSKPGGLCRGCFTRARIFWGGVAFAYVKWPTFSCVCTVFRQPTANIYQPFHSSKQHTSDSIHPGMQQVRQVPLLTAPNWHISIMLNLCLLPWFVTHSCVHNQACDCKVTCQIHAIPLTNLSNSATTYKLNLKPSLPCGNYPYILMAYAFPAISSQGDCLFLDCRLQSRQSGPVRSWDALLVEPCP